MATLTDPRTLNKPPEGIGRDNWTDLLGRWHMNRTGGTILCQHLSGPDGAGNNGIEGTCVRCSCSLCAACMQANTGVSHNSVICPECDAWVETHPLYSSGDVAYLFDITPRRVRQLAESRNIGQFVGGTYVFTDADISAMQKRETGRPKRS